MTEIANERPVSVLLFDLGRVIFNLDFQRAWQSWSSASGVDASVLESRFHIDDAYKQYENGKISAAEFTRHFNAQLSIDLSATEFLDGWNAIFTSPVDGMHDLLLTSKKHLQIYAFSNTNADHEIVWRSKFADSIALFEHVFTSNGIGHRKPDRAGFLHVVSSIGEDPGDILFFDDLEENIDGARDTGLRAELFIDAPTAGKDIERLARTF